MANSPPLVRLRQAWNVFVNGKDLEPDFSDFSKIGMASYTNPLRNLFGVTNEKNVIHPIHAKIGNDVASYDFSHVLVNSEGAFTGFAPNSTLNDVLSFEANKDQTGRGLVLDIAMSMFDEGVVAVVPVDTIQRPTESGAFSILSLRTGKVIEWFPDHVKLEIYNDNTGLTEEKVLPKRMVAIIENPFYAIMNEPNGTVSRLVRKLSLLDVTDEQQASGKMNLIIQLPYLLKTQTKMKEAEVRRAQLEEQLMKSKYGIAYSDSTEKITQLNKSPENNLFQQVKDLTDKLYGELGITPNIMNGTASQAEMAAYFDRTVEPVVTAIVEEMTRKFLTKTARTRGHRVLAYRNSFRLLTALDVAEMADALSRNEIVTPNELRAALRLKPSADPKSDELSNRNMPNDQMAPETQEVPIGQQLAKDVI